MAKGMPPVTVENVVATLEKFSMEADMIFRARHGKRLFKARPAFQVSQRV